MLFHVSVEADDPQPVAEALAKIWGGEAFPFPPVGEGSWVALAGDQFGSMIEVYRRGTELFQGADGAIGIQMPPRRHAATHFAMGTPLTAEEVFDIAHHQGWKAQYCRRANRFGLVEMWIDDCLMVEVLTKEMQREYLDTITIESYRRMIEDPGFTQPMADAA